ncbi:hypothetical protein ETW23_03900 [Leisingera sp. NJS201]|uniref:hypothetical protein n=1 Tax=Leisingera sp. NJS201 TaxID=2508306 RepID=UPI001070DDF9|nr:hypothetical protein [Leisingera sp. NJS201]QBR35410.1 hypothetical protein ETW23_03900 [Leisingera sp. NJS201]
MSGTDLERLNIILAARDREFAKAMDRNIRRVERFAKRSDKHLSNVSRKFDVMGFAAKRAGGLLAAFGAAKVIGKLKGTVAALDDIGKTADKIGLTTDALQELRTVAESAGVAQGALDSSLERFNKRLGEAAQGSGAAAKTLKSLGLEASDLATMGLDASLSVVADRIAALPDPTQKAAAAAALFGREGVAMVNLLREGSDGMAKMRQEARDLGIIIDEDLIRGAEDAQTQLDLMGRVISAQLNSALIELAPLLVAGATATADLVRAINSGIDAFQNWLNPQSNLQIATENLVLAMGDEIRQSQLLDQALGKGITFSQAAAKAKLEEATARHENAKAAVAEHKAMVLGSEDWANLSTQISQAQGAIRATEGPRADDTVSRMGDAYEQQQLVLAQLIKDRQEMLRLDNELADQLERTGQNMATLQEAIGNSGGGLVKVDGTAINPIEPSQKGGFQSAGDAAKASVPELTDYAAVVERIKGALGDAVQVGGSYQDMLAQLQALHEAGLLSAEDYEAAVGTVEDRFAQTKNASDSLRSSAAQTFADIVTGAQSASDAISGLLSNWAQMFANAAFTGFLKDTGITDWAGDLLSFDGGGYTGSGPRSGGLDGKGGYLAMVHPNESVIDHTKGQSGPSGGGGGAVNINVKVSGARGNSEIRDMVETGVRQGLQHYDRKQLPLSVQQINNDPRRIG